MPSYNFRCVQQSFMQHADLPFSDPLTEETIEQAFDDEGVAFGQGEDDVCTPAFTLWAFLPQVLCKDELLAWPPSPASPCCWRRWGASRAWGSTLPLRGSKANRHCNEDEYRE